ncbi:MAG: DUF1232 domain-containing protein [Candidatus Methylomirabilales bacterium]
MAPRLKQILLILGALLYIVSPVDFLPDLLPGLGWLDDLIVLGLLLWSLFGLGSRPGGVFQGGGAKVRPAEGSQDPHTVLEVAKGASTEEIRAAYRRMVAQYHPDKVSHLGRELQEMAHQKLIAVQQAYEEIMRGQIGG